MEGIVAECLIADRGYDSDAIIEQGHKAGHETCHSTKEEPDKAKAV